MATPQVGSKARKTALAVLQQRLESGLLTVDQELRAAAEIRKLMHKPKRKSVNAKPDPNRKPEYD